MKPPAREHRNNGGIEYVPLALTVAKASVFIWRDNQRLEHMPVPMMHALVAQIRYVLAAKCLLKVNPCAIIGVPSPDLGLELAAPDCKWGKVWVWLYHNSS